MKLRIRLSPPAPVTQDSAAHKNDGPGRMGRITAIILTREQITGYEHPRKMVLNGFDRFIRLIRPESGENNAQNP